MIPKKNQGDQNLFVVVTYNPRKVNLSQKSYQYGNSGEFPWILRQQLNLLIKNTLKKGVKALGETNSLRILDDKVIQKHEIGDFQFDPFCYCIKIELRAPNQAKFKDYKLPEQSKIKIEYNKEQKMDEMQKQSNSKISTYKLIKQACKNIRFPTGTNMEQLELELTQVLDKLGIDTIERLKGRTVTQLKQQTKFTRVVCEEIHKIVNNNSCETEAKFMSTKINDFSPQFLQLKEQCLQFSTSHRILRYCVWRNFPELLPRVPYLNYLSVKKALQLTCSKIKLDQGTKNQLRQFLQQYCSPNISKFERGAIFNGPPGTGKTEITELLMYLSGFVLISSGKSSSDFKKSYVGEAGRMIEGLFSRANCCPYLLCSIAIDEIEGAFPDRNNKDEKNSGEATSQFLSVIEGNKNIPNVILLSSTNHINKIDPAILRRLGEQFYLPRLSMKFRKEILSQSSEYFGRKESLFDLIVTLTKNFTGSAFKKLISSLENKRSMKIEKKSRSIEITQQEIRQEAIKIAREYKIMFGTRTYPQIIENSSDQLFLSLPVLKKFEHNLMFVQLERENKIQLHHMNHFLEWSKQQFNLVTKIQRNSPLSIQSLGRYLLSDVDKCLGKNGVLFQDFQQLKKKYNSLVGVEQRQPQFLIFVTKQVAPDLTLFTSAFPIKKKKENVFIFIVCQNASCLEGKLVERENTGRIILQVNESPRIVFQLKSNSPKDIKLQIHQFLRGPRMPTTDDFIPYLVNIFDSKGLSNIFMIDNQTLVERNALNEQKCIETIEAIVNEGRKFQEVAVIINLDSLLVSSKLTKQQQGKISTDFTVDDRALYRSLVNIARNFYSIGKNEQKWLAIIVRDDDLLEKLCRDISWPQMPEETEKMRKREEDNRQRKCIRCCKVYTEAKNREEPQCLIHPGPIINTSKGSWATPQEGLEQEYYRQAFAAQIQLFEYGKKNENRNLPAYIYSCCFASVKESQNFCSNSNAFHHIQKQEYGTKKDLAMTMQNERSQYWQTRLNQFKKWKQKIYDI